MPFEFKSLAIKEVILIKPKRFVDNRGFFLETYKRSEFIKAGIKEDFVQHNHSRSSKGVLRGLHYQMHPYAQGKLIRCIRGAILDVAVDIRKGSPTYGAWTAEVLSEDNGLMLFIPLGFAHGFLTLADDTEIIYTCTSEYAPEYDRGIIWNDKDIGIKWGCDTPALSPKDAQLPSLKDAENNFIYQESL